MSNKEARKAAVAQVMAELRADYQIALPGKVKALEDALAAIRRQPTPSPNTLQEGIRLAHRLRGTGGSFGFAGVSASSGQIEDALKAMPPSAEPEGQAEMWRVIDQALAGLRATLTEED